MKNLKNKLYIIISFILLIASDAMMDKLRFHFSKSIFQSWDPQFWNPAISWRNKYIDGDPAKGRKKLWGIQIPVIFTDGWHAIKAVKIFLIILPYAWLMEYFGWGQWWYNQLIGIVGWSIIFEYLFADVFVKEKETI